MSNKTGFKMDPAKRDAWTDALESGRYSQLQNALIRVFPDDSKQHCCLGVKAEIEDISMSNNSYGGSVYLRFTEFSTAQAVDLPLDVTDQLIWMNDNGKTFHEIAEWIKENL